MTNEGDSLTALLEGLEGRIPAGRRRDAIDAILAGEPRTTAVRSLSDHEVVQQFRRELSDGLIRVDTANRLLGLIRMVVEAAMK